MAVRAQVEGLRTAGPYSVVITLSYEASGGGLEPLPGSRDTISLGEGGSRVEQRIAVVLDACLEDDGRAQAGSGGCVLWITLQLLDSSGLLDEESVDLGVVQPGDQVVSPAAITLVPEFTLTISGGGDGTGSGVIRVPAAADQPELSCEITDGTAAPTGCSARYPLHTTVALSVAEGTLGAWGAECQDVPASSPCQLTLDGHRTAGASFVAPPTTGDLLVQIAGLPGETAAQVTVTNDRGYRQDLTETTLLTALSPGDDYLVTASPVPVAAEERTYNPSPTSQPVTIVAGESRTAQIGYNPPETGGLAVAVLGLPQGVAARITVTGPSFEEPRQLTTGETLTGLEPGVYTITAEDVETSTQIFAPTPRVADSAVVGGTTANHTVTYTPTRGALTVSLSGLPAGAQAAVTVTGPNFSRSLTGTETLLKLVPGTYVVTAEHVRVDGRTFAPAPHSQPILVNAGATPVAGVGYAVLRAARLEKLTQDNPTCFVNTFCENLFAVRASDTAGFTVAQARVRWTALNPTEGCPEGSHTDVNTDLSGVARGSNECSYPTPGTYSQSATIVIDGEPVPSTEVRFTFTLSPTPPSPDRSSVEVSLDTVRTCCDTATVTVTARDANGAPLSGRTVVLEASSTAVVIQAQPSAQTGEDGVARGLVIGRAIGSAGVVATIDGVRINQVATVAVTAGIVFVDGFDIYAMTQGGARPINLTRGAFNNPGAPVWSPDGSRLAFVEIDDVCGDTGCGEDLYVMNADGSQALNLTAEFPEDAHDPTWSPDGSSIAFHSDPCDGEGLCRQIWVVQTTGSTPIPITPEESSAFSPDWSPDGSRIVFVSRVCFEDDCVTTLQTMDSEGENRVPLSTAFGIGDFPEDPRWSPDGARIAFTLRTCDNECLLGRAPSFRDIVVVNSGGSDPVNLTSGLENNASQPAWSPGGGRIAFNYDSCNDGCDEITLMSSRDGSDVTPLLGGSEPHWR